ncbi:MAG: type II secretion system F family protein [bacterium]|nr:type II secretion system F family protein [Candidatus Jorgensenbacteria bacterium]
MKFNYKARTKEGELQVGNVEAASRESAANVLLGHGLFVLSIEEVKENTVKSRISQFFERVKNADLMVFTRQFATLLASQVPLNDSLASLHKQTTNPILKQAIYEMGNDLSAGFSLSQSLERHGGIFSEFYVNMVRAAEVTGRLAEVLEFLADYLEKQNVLISKVKSALYYPAFIIAIFFAVVVVMVTTVLPQLAPIFLETKTELPFFTKLMFSSGQIISDWWWAILVVLGIIGFMLVDYFMTDEGKTVLDEVSLRIPIIGSVFQKLYIARFAEAARVLIRGGLTIPQAIEISSRTISNAAYRELLHKAAEEVRRGKLLSQALAEMSEFPPLVSQLIAVGESTGRIEILLEKINLFYSRQVEDTVDNLVNLIQPILMLAIGVMVAILFASILLPLYSVSQSFSSG